MKRFLPLLSLFVALMSATAFADHIYLIPNNGSGDNFGFVGRMNGHQLLLSGGTTASFFSTDGYPPGLTFGGQTELFLYSTVIAPSCGSAASLPNSFFLQAHSS